MTKHTHLTLLQKLLRKHSGLAITGGSLLLIGLLVLAGKSADPLDQSARAFSDVQEDSIPSTAIEEMAQLGIMRGYDNGLFGPDDPVTRAQVAILLKRIRDREISALRAQIEEIRGALSLGQCSDAEVQTGEECDDGNTASGDGCSAACLTEVRDGVSSCTTMRCSAPAEDPVTEEPEEEMPVGAAPNMAPSCGNGMCEAMENDLPPDQRFHCPEDCTGAPPSPLQCDTLTEDFKDIPDAARTCSSDYDCVKIEQSCPFVTCGEPVNKSNFPKYEMKLDTLIETCRREGDVRACVMCPYSAAVCQNGQCVLVEESQ